MSLKRLLSERGSSRNSLRRHSSKGSQEKQITSIIDLEMEKMEIVQEIMQEVLENTLEKIHEKYMENQTIKFVVHCAHQALMKVLRFHFYQHNDYIRSPERWSSDRRISPSPADSWAISQVPTHKNIFEERELNTLSRIQLEVTERGGEIIAKTDVDLTSEPSEGLLDDIRAIIDEIIDNLPIVDSDHFRERSSSIISAFTSVVTGLRHYNDFRMKPQISRVSIGSSTTVRLPRIDLPESGHSKKKEDGDKDMKTDLDKLPPIRTDAKYKCRPNTLPEDKTKKTKKDKDDKSLI